MMPTAYHSGQLGLNGRRVGVHQLAVNFDVCAPLKYGGWPHLGNCGSLGLVFQLDRNPIANAGIAIFGDFKRSDIFSADVTDCVINDDAHGEMLPLRRAA
jgi:hypothetical protein